MDKRFLKLTGLGLILCVIVEFVARCINYPVGLPYGLFYKLTNALSVLWFALLVMLSQDQGIKRIGVVGLLFNLFFLISCFVPLIEWSLEYAMIILVLNLLIYGRLFLLVQGPLAKLSALGVATCAVLGNINNILNH